MAAAREAIPSEPSKSVTIGWLGSRRGWANGLAAVALAVVLLLFSSAAAHYFANATSTLNLKLA